MDLFRPALPKAYNLFCRFNVSDLLKEKDIRANKKISYHKNSSLYPQFNLYDALKFTPLSNTPVIPNVNLGKISASWLKSKFKGKEIDVKYDEPLGSYVVITDPKSKGYIRVMVAHAPSAYKAQIYLCLFRFVCSVPTESHDQTERFETGWRESSPEKIAEKTLINFMKVGDFSISNRPETVRFLRYIPSEVESEIIFMRGNTVVGVQSSDPTKSLLKLAKFIDKTLQGELK